MRYARKAQLKSDVAIIKIKASAQNKAGERHAGDGTRVNSTIVNKQLTRFSLFPSGGTLRPNAMVTGICDGMGLYEIASYAVFGKRSGLFQRLRFLEIAP